MLNAFPIIESLMLSPKIVSKKITVKGEKERERGKDLANKLTQTTERSKIQRTRKWLICAVEFDKSSCNKFERSL